MPIVPHSTVAGVDCCGCIIAAVEGTNVELRCNECGAVVGVIQVDILKGSVAKFWRSDSGGCKVVNCRIRLGGEPEQPGDEESLADRISFCQPSHSALPNHVHRFNSL